MKYEEKRDFEKTPEPKDIDINFDWAEKRPIFVIQKHDASRLHYDFRIEVDGLLKSWAVPRGPSTDPAKRRLAIRTEDHPLAYADFEGQIPKDQYGGGTVMVWDRGYYLNNKANQNDDKPAISISEQIENGHVTIWLEGMKISGGYALIRTENAEEKAPWLLIKMKDEKAQRDKNPVKTRRKSVKTGRDLDDIAKE